MASEIKAIVLYNNKEAGYLIKTNNGFTFQYLEQYLSSHESAPLCYNLPLTQEPFFSKKLFPFFAELISEGWNLSFQSRQQKIDKRDYFKLLLENGEDLIGAVSVKKEA